MSFGREGRAGTRTIPTPVRNVGTVSTGMPHGVGGEHHGAADMITRVWARIASVYDMHVDPIDYLPVDQGSLRGAVIDLQGRFNINNLGTTNPQQLAQWTTIFTRLLQQADDHIDDYKANSRAIGAVWKRLMGDGYPAMAAVGVTRLWDVEAMVEVQGHAIISESPPRAGGPGQPAGR